MRRVVKKNERPIFSQYGLTEDLLLREKFHDHELERHRKRLARNVNARKQIDHNLFYFTRFARSGTQIQYHVCIETKSLRKKMRINTGKQSDMLHVLSGPKCP